MKYLCFMLSWLILIAYFIIGHAILSALFPAGSDVVKYLLLAAPCAFVFGLVIWFWIDDRRCYLNDDEIGSIVVGQEQKGSEFQQETTQKHSINVKC